MTAHIHPLELHDQGSTSLGVCVLLSGGHIDLSIGMQSVADILPSVEIPKFIRRPIPMETPNSHKKQLNSEDTGQIFSGSDIGPTSA